MGEKPVKKLMTKWTKNRSKKLIEYEIKKCKMDKVVKKKKKTA